MLILYRILSFFVSFFCAFLAMGVLSTIIYALSDPGLLLPCFVFGSVVLYAWFANRFFGTVVIRKATMKKKQKDWLQVNAIVAFIFSLLCVIGSIEVYADPKITEEFMKSLPAGADITSQQLMNAFNVFFALCLLLLIHVIWTYILIRKNKAAFIEEK